MSGAICRWMIVLMGIVIVVRVWHASLQQDDLKPASDELSQLIDGQFQKHYDSDGNAVDYSKVYRVIFRTKSSTRVKINPLFQNQWLCKIQMIIWKITMMEFRLKP